LRALPLFLLTSLLGGLGGALGSIVGHAVGPRALYAGGVLGGLLMVSLATWIARRRGWISAAQQAPATVGAALGSLAAALVAVNTLSSPVGPVLSTLLVGAGAVLGAWARRSS
jgi:hypothetical protein